jgi:hypothetical protein
LHDHEDGVGGNRAQLTAAAGPLGLTGESSYGRLPTVRSFLPLVIRRRVG